MGFLRNLFKTSNAKPDIDKLISKKNIKGLIDVLSVDDSQENWDLTNKAVAALEEMGDTRTVDMLINGINKRYENPDFVGRAIKTLGKIGDRKAVEPIIKALEYKACKGVPVWAAEALGEIGDKKAVEPLIKALKHEWYYTRAAAAESLGKIGDKKAIDPLIPLLADSSSVAAEAAAEALAKIGDEKSIDALIAALSRSSCVAYDTLIKFKIRTPKAVNPLIMALHYDRDDIRNSAAEALGEMGDKRAIEPLLPLLCDREWPVRKSAATALGKLGYQPSSEEDKAAMLFALRRWGELEEAGVPGVEVLVKFLDDGSSIRKDIISTLARIGEPAVDSVVGALRTSDWRVRNPAMDVLARIGTETAVEAIIEFLESGLDQVRGARPTPGFSHNRQHAADCLCKFKNERAIQALRRCLDDSDLAVRKIAERSLRELEEPSSPGSSCSESQS